MRHRIRALAGSSGLCLLFACSGSQSPPPSPPADGMVGRLDAHRQLAPPVVADPIQVWPIVTDAPVDGAST